MRSVVSIWPEAGEAPGVAEDEEQVTNGEIEGAVPLLTGPYGLAGRGFVERQTPTGWRDEQHESFPVASGHEPTDLPRPNRTRSWPSWSRRTAAPAGLSAAKPANAWATRKEQVQTAGVMRYGAAAAPPSNFRSVPIPAGAAGTATFAFGGGAQCAGPLRRPEGHRHRPGSLALPARSAPRGERAGRP